MASNIEIKAILPDPGRTRKLARQLAAAEPQTLHQRDTFFNSPSGRLKLRETPEHCELIAYDRPDTASIKQSLYEISSVDDPASMKAVLQRSMGIRGVVEKVRQLWIVGQTRIHIDQVIGLGEFIELEVVMDDSSTAAEGQRCASEFMSQLAIRPDDLIDIAYIDLLEQIGQSTTDASSLNESLQDAP